MRVTVSITDVARAAGVSASTVSRALRGQPGVSEEVREQIAVVAARLSAQRAGHGGRGDSGGAGDIGDADRHPQITPM
jgi:transcriptional regulator with XRE-family HTH domain